MLLAIDAGNTNIVFAVFDGGKLREQWRISTDARRTADEYGVWLTQVMEHSKISPSSINAAILASVVPQALFDLKSLCKRYFHCELMVVGEPNVKLGMQARIDNPAEVGADRIVNALAAWKKYQLPCIIIDFGTATTFDVVNEKGEYVGGVIAPGVNLSLDALQRAAAKLPNIAIARPEKVIGTNTVAAMQSGIYYGYVGLIEGIVARIKEEISPPIGGRVRGGHVRSELNSKYEQASPPPGLPPTGGGLKVIATGGLAALYSKACPAIEAVEPDLTIEGLHAIYQANQ